MELTLRLTKKIRNSWRLSKKNMQL